MCIVAIVSSSSCSGDEVASAVASRLGCTVTGTEQILLEASSRSSLSAERLRRALLGPRSVFNRLTKEKERGVGVVRQTLARMVQADDMVIHSFAVHLLPTELTQVLRVGLAAPMDFRIARRIVDAGVDRSEAEEQLRAEEEDMNRWTQYLFGVHSLSKSLYDIFLPMDSVPVEEAVETILDGARAPALAVSDDARLAAADFLITADVYLALAEAGRGEDILVSVREGDVTITINRYVMWLERFEREVKKIASAVSGVREVETRVGPHFRRPNVYPGLDVEVPQKILLVDDESEFVQTLSDRLLSRNLESAVALNGQEALAIAENDAPDVIVLDVKMPGMDGMEVLERLKSRHPEIQVIILTAHGSEEGAKRARELGAFAYLRKPTNIDELVRMMKEAHKEAKGDTKVAEDGGRPEEGSGAPSD